MRGEHSIAAGNRRLAGSSPHARGTRLQAEPDIRASVHPRMRGEHTTERHIRAATGSSPHARGTRRIARASYVAGLSPHARGTRRAARWASNLIGSSPHARGTLVIAAGCPPSRAVHPRMRGEHEFTTLLSAPVHPRMRGEHSSGQSTHHSRRFIPACAGNTRLLRSAVAFAVHPRMRGEHGSPIQRDAVQHGSSPHARGTLAGRCQQAQARFIPARAGNTLETPSAIHCATGSSPHARGTPPSQA